MQTTASVRRREKKAGGEGASGEEFDVSHVDDVSVFGSSNQAYTDPALATNDPKVVGPQKLQLFPDQRARWQFQYCHNFVFSILVAVALIAALVLVGTWSRKANGELVSERGNLTAVGSVRQVLLGRDSPLSPLDRELVVGQLRVDNSNNNTVPVAAVRASHRAENGYLNTTQGHLQLLTSDGGELRCALYVDNEQRVGIGTASPQSTLHVGGLLTADGGILDLSDKRTKENISPLASEHAIRVLKAVEAKHFVRKNAKTGRVEVGFLAQDFQRAGADDVVVEMKDGLLRLDRAAITAYLWTAVRHTLLAQEDLD